MVKVRIVCCICNSKRGNNRTFFSFPKEKTEKSAWLKALKFDESDPVHSLRVCSQHFSPNVIIDNSNNGGRKILDKSAVPVFACINPLNLSTPCDQSNSVNNKRLKSDENDNNSIDEETTADPLKSTPSTSSGLIKLVPLPTLTGAKKICKKPATTTVNTKPSTSGICTKSVTSTSTSINFRDLLTTSKKSKISTDSIELNTSLTDSIESTKSTDESEILNLPEVTTIENARRILSICKRALIEKNRMLMKIRRREINLKKQVASLEKTLMELS